MKKNLAYRSWFYLRQGWATYFAFIFAALNTLTVTYYLAIERLPVLKEVFPSFAIYVIIVSMVGIPLLVIIGYIHMKRSGAYRSDADISFESNPHFLRLLSNSETTLLLYLKMSQILLRISSGEKLSQMELDEMKQLQKQLEVHIKDSTIDKLKRISTDKQ
ncbi:MAG: hypothetical protein QW177_08345 [Candidatus Nitrosotenuis sp.]